jgi:hypothetical protein
MAAATTVTTVGCQHLRSPLRPDAASRGSGGISVPPGMAGHAAQSRMFCGCWNAFRMRFVAGKAREQSRSRAQVRDRGRAVNTAPPRSDSIALGKRADQRLARKIRLCILRVRARCNAAAVQIVSSVALGRCQAEPLGVLLRRRGMTAWLLRNGEAGDECGEGVAPDPHFLAGRHQPAQFHRCESLAERMKLAGGVSY